MKVELIVARRTGSLLGVRMWVSEGHHTMKMLVWDDGSVNHFYDGRLVDSYPSSHKKVFDMMYQRLMDWGSTWIRWGDFIPYVKYVQVGA